MSAAQKNGIILVAVTLNAKSDWSDHKAMLEYGFGCLETKEQKDIDFDHIRVLGGTKKALMHAFMKCLKYQ